MTGTARGRRWAALGLGLLAGAAYAGGAWLSGSASPMARRPLLDGSIIPQPYRWVAPPPAFADTNKPPDSGEFTVTFTGSTSDAGVFSTNDQQASVVLSRGAITRVGGARSVHLTVDPLDPATAGPPPHGLTVLGNVYRIEATYDPGGAPVTKFLKQPLVVLVYPALVTHGLDRNLLFAPDGRNWTELRTTDDPTAFQASASVDDMTGSFEVVTRGGGTPSPPPAGGGTGSVLPWIVIGVAVVVAAALIAARLRSRAQAREYDSYRRESAGTTASARPPGSARGTSARRKSRKKRRR
jgi:hypothetical protein